MTAPLAPVAAAGDAAGMGCNALAVGTLSAGVICVMTGSAPTAGSVGGSLVDVTLSVDVSAPGVPGDDFLTTRTFSPTQITSGSDLPSLATTTVQRPGGGFSIMPTVAAAAYTLYVFKYTSS